VEDIGMDKNIMWLAKRLKDIAADL